MEETYIGILPDNRIEEEKAKDYKFEELVVSAAPVNWKEKSQTDWRKFPIYDQGQSGSCVAQTMRKLQSIYFFLGSNFFPHLSASHIYQRRANKPSAGMMGHDAFQIAQKGVTLEEFAPSHRLSDSQMDNIKVVPFMEEVGKTFAIGQYLSVKPDIDTIASIIQQTGKGVMLWFYFKQKSPTREWIDVPKVLDPGLNLYASDTARHSITAVDFTLYNGKKALIIEDSWGLDAAMQGQRVITEDFFNARCYFAAHFMNFKFETTDPTNNEPFLQDLELNMENTEVQRLQDVLKKLGYFPTNVASTGFYGNITATAVGKFQEAYNIVAKGGSGYGRLGPITRAKLNSVTK